MRMVAEEVICWAELTGCAITTHKITQMTVTMHRHKMIKAPLPPMDAVRGEIIELVQTQHRDVTVDPVPAPDVPPPPAGNPDDIPDLDNVN
jgi:hypothetical protein